MLRMSIVSCHQIINDMAMKQYCCEFQYIHILVYILTYPHITCIVQTGRHTGQVYCRSAKNWVWIYFSDIYAHYMHTIYAQCMRSIRTIYVRHAHPRSVVSCHFLSTPETSGKLCIQAECKAVKRRKAKITPKNAQLYSCTVEQHLHLQAEQT